MLLESIFNKEVVVEIVGHNTEGCPVLVVGWPVKDLGGVHREDSFQLVAFLDFGGEKQKAVKEKEVALEELLLEILLLVEGGVGVAGGALAGRALLHQCQSLHVDLVRVLAQVELGDQLGLALPHLQLLLRGVDANQRLHCVANGCLQRTDLGLFVQALKDHGVAGDPLNRHDQEGFNGLACHLLLGLEEFVERGIALPEV